MNECEPAVHHSTNTALRYLFRALQDCASLYRPLRDLPRNEIVLICLEHDRILSIPMVTTEFALMSLNHF